MLYTISNYFDNFFSSMILSAFMSNLTPLNLYNFFSNYINIHGREIVFDPKNSHGSYLFDKKSKREFLDFYSFFGSVPLGYNYPSLITDEFKEELFSAALINPSNTNFYTLSYGKFLDTFISLGNLSKYCHFFFIQGGSLAVENALKCAFDWKVRKNLEKGNGERGYKIIHFEQSFHGRSGYTLSMTNTYDLNKTKYFPKFDWPRIFNPKIFYPNTQDNLAKTIKLEEMAIDKINELIKNDISEIAAICVEPIQCEAGDNHFRGEFLCKLREITYANELLLIFDEVQTGFGATGKMWACEHFDIVPDILVFGKKSQVSGIAVTNRIDDLPNVFTEKGRINSTCGGSLVDMVRAKRYLEIYTEDKILENASTVGEYLKSGLIDISVKYNTISNVRGLGMIIGFDLPSSDQRTKFLDSLFLNGLLAFGCGERSVRFRPSLALSKEDADRGLEIIRSLVQGKMH